MNSDEIKGKVKQFEGKVQDAKGDLTNNPTDDIEGKAKKVGGKIQEEWGKAKDQIRDMDKHAA